jgi:hypothetical protein
MPPSTVTPSPIPKKKSNNCKMPPVEIMVEMLQHGSKYTLKKGCYLLGERSKGGAAAGRGGENGEKWLPKTERLQLLSEVLLLESYNESTLEAVLGRG